MNVKCIFCGSTEGPFGTIEHILPESLGGGDWSILRNGLFCDKCQNRFGSQVEQQALGDYPFSFLRVFMGIPTKKRREPWLTCWEGTIRACGEPGKCVYDPKPLFEGATANGSKTVIRLLAHPRKPEMVCRFLLKMGLEVVANDCRLDVFDTKFDEARNYALTGKKTQPWWYLQHEDLTAATKYLTNAASLLDWEKGFALEVHRLEEGHEVFHLRLLYIDVFAPLTVGVEPTNDFIEPEYRLFRL